MSQSPADVGRRQALGAMAAAAGGMPWLAQAAAPLRRVGIVGAGMAGVATAWLLDGQRAVQLFEAAPALGGNVQSLDLVVDGQPVRVDIGAQFFHPGPYPHYVALLEQLGLYPPSTGGCHGFVASITLADPSEAQPRFVSPVLPGRAWPLAAPWNRAGLQAFNVAFAAAQRREQRDASWQLTLGEWLPTLGLTPAQWQGMLLPWAASLHNGDIAEAANISARAAMVFAALALPERPTDPVVYNVLEASMVEPLQRMLAQCSTVQLRTGSAVVAVQRLAGGGFRLGTAAGALHEVDDLVFAASGEPTLQLLSGLPGSAAQRAALQGIGFFDARLMLHTDPVYAPPAAPQVSFLNCAVQGNACEASMDMARVLSAPAGGSPPALWKSWVTHRQQLPAQVLHEASFRHLLPTPATLRAQGRLRALQGQGGVWFAGGYTQPYDAQETALLSAMAVADGLGVASARRAALASR